MADFVHSAREIPNAEYYVLATDKFLSGWGMSHNRDNVVILPCESWEEATVVLRNARRRGDMKRARINTAKPRLHPWNTYSLMNRDKAERWYTPNGF